MPVLIGFGLIAFSLFFKRHVMRIRWDKVAEFVGFMVLVSFVRLALYSWTTNNIPSAIPDYGIPAWQFLLVPWEDAFYVLPYLLTRKYLPNWLWTSLFTFSCIWFASGHLYQGTVWAAITLLYPLISYKYSVKHGIGTVMACHVIFDFFSHCSTKLFPYLL